MEDSSQARVDIRVFKLAPGSRDLTFTIQEFDNQDIPSWRNLCDPIAVSEPGFYRRVIPRPTRPRIRVRCSESCSARVMLHMGKVDGELDTFFVDEEA